MCFEGGERGANETVGFGGRVVLSGAVIRFINAGIASHRDSSSLLVLTHSVTSFLWRAIGSASVSLSLHLPLSLSSSGSRRLSVSQTLSFFPSLSLFFLFSPPRCLCFHPSLSLPLVPDSFASSVSLLFMFISLSPSLSLSLSPQPVRADIKGGLRQVVRRGFARLRETRDEERKCQGDSSAC